MRPRATQAYWTYVEELDGSETQQIQVFPAFGTRAGEKVRLGGTSGLVAPTVACGHLPYARLDAGNAELLDRFLRLAKEQDVLDRVMFGSDQMRWPETIETAVQRIKALDYLMDVEKAGILYDNAARFLRLDEKTIARHHGEEPRSER